MQRYPVAQAQKPSTKPIARSSTKEFELLLNDFYFRLEERDKWYDQAIKYLLFGNGGGVALLITFIGALSRSGQWIPSLIIPLSLFLGGIVPIGMVVFLSAKCAKEGRDGVRELLNQFIKGETSYDEAFLQIGNWPSTWKKTRAALVTSFIFFLSGIVASAGVYYLHPNVAISGSSQRGPAVQPDWAKPDSPPS